MELSLVGLRFRGRQASSNDVLKGLEPVYNALSELGDQDALNEKLAEYSFFPLSHIFNETQRLSARCLEVAVNCLRVLVTKGWRQQLSPQMGKQLIILLTLIVGGTPNQNQDKAQKPQPEELIIAGFDCLASIFSVLQGREAERTIYHEVGTATIVDQTVYILLEGVADDKSDDLCLAAARALQALYLCITDRVVLASMMPRTVSALTKVIRPTTQTRHSYRLSVVCVQILTQMLRTVLSDSVAVTSEKSTQPEQANDRMVLDDSWLKATTAQIKLALAHVIQIRRHRRAEVQDAILELCVMVIEACQATLQDSLSIMVETAVVLSELDSSGTPNAAYSTLTHLATTYPTVLSILKDSLHSWLTSFPRTMQGNDETVKQHAIRQISTAFQILSHVQSSSNLLTTSLASGLCDSVAVAVNHAASVQPLTQDPTNNFSLDVISQNTKALSFPPILLEHRSQQQTLGDLQSMINMLNVSSSGPDVARSIVNRMHGAVGNSIIAPFWLALTFVNNSQRTSSFDEFISSDLVEGPSSSAAGIIEELYCISLPMISDPGADNELDWRASALAMEAIALEAQQIGKAFRPELMDALYPTLQFLASGNPHLQRHAMTCLNLVTEACQYPDVSTMIMDNVDYLVNAVGLKLNTFDVSPYPPQVLLMMVKLCGARLIPYLDDLVDAVFGMLDMYHGYPKFVEMMFKTLAAIVEEGTNQPALLAITDDEEPERIDHRKQQYQRLQMSTLAEDFAARRAKRLSAEETDNDKIPHPKQPWRTEPQGEKAPDPEIDNISELLSKAETDDPLPPPQEPSDSEKPLSKSHNLLLHIVKSIPPHLSSPSPYLRRSLLSILIEAMPVLAHNENSFLPLINDVWSSVVSKITFPSSFTESSSTTLMRTNPTGKEARGTEFDYQEELYVITTACQTVQVICETAGDFTASRIETEYPRWERLYRRSWEKVRSDAEKAISRRAQHQHQQPQTGKANLIPAFSLSLSVSTSAASGPRAGTRTFTPHHTLFRALTSLFITLLSNVRLPLSVGDQICEFLVSWVVMYVGGEYYFDLQRRGQVNRLGKEEEGTAAVDEAIRVMNAWNADLVWGLFFRERVLSGRKYTGRTRAEGEDAGKGLSIPGTSMKLAAVAF